MTDSLISYPNAARVVTSQLKKIVLGVIGRSGVGKSHLVYQLARDADYGPDEVLVVMSEDATSTYDSPVHVVHVESIAHILATVDELARLAAQGKRIPKVLVWDSPSGTGDDEMEAFEVNPNLTKKGERDKLSEYGDFGKAMTAVMRRFHKRCPCDVIVLMTSHEGDVGRAPELAVPGKMTPKNFTRLTSSCLHMCAIKGTFDPAQGIPPPAPHRTIAFDERGKPILENGLGIIIQRYMYTQDAGEVMAKGHHALAVRERAVLPEILKKIHNYGQAEVSSEVAERKSREGSEIQT
jgi:hypothetical protein